MIVYRNVYDITKAYGFIFLCLIIQCISLSPYASVAVPRIIIYAHLGFKTVLCYKTVTYTIIHSLSSAIRSITTNSEHAAVLNLNVQLLMPDVTMKSVS